MLFSSPTLFLAMRRLKKEEKLLLRRDVVTLRTHTKMSKHEIAARLDVSMTLVKGALQKAAEGSLADKPRSGRPRKTSTRADRRIVATSKRHPLLTAAACHVQSGIHTALHKSSVCRRLKAGGLQSRRCAKVPALTKKHMTAQRRWATRFKNFNFDKVVFSDEKRFALQHDGPSRCWRLKGKRYALQNVQSHAKFGGGGLMVWGALNATGVSPLILLDGTLNAEKYIQIIEALLQKVPRLRSRATQRLVFQQDNAAPHTAAAVTDYFQKYIQYPSAV